MAPTPSTPPSPAAPGTTTPVAETWLADRLWSRYGGAPGVVAPPLARRLLQRAARFQRDPLPLLTVLQRRLAATNLLPASPMVFPDAILPPALSAAESPVTASPAAAVSKLPILPTVTPNIVNTARVPDAPTVAPRPAAITNPDGQGNQETPPAVPSRQSQPTPNPLVVRAYRATTEPTPSPSQAVTQSPNHSIMPVSTIGERGLVTDTAPLRAPHPTSDRGMVVVRSSTAGATARDNAPLATQPSRATPRNQAAIPVVTAQVTHTAPAMHLSPPPQGTDGQHPGPAIPVHHETGTGRPLIQRKATAANATDDGDAASNGEAAAKVAVTVADALQQSVGAPLTFAPPPATQPPVTLLQTAQPLLQRLLGPPPTVRLHTDAKAATAATALGAAAFTTGRDIFFAAGQADLTQPQGVALLTHELTHVVQQQQAGGNPLLLQTQGLEQMALANEQIIQRALTPTGAAVPMAALPVVAPRASPPTPQRSLPTTAPSMPSSAGPPPARTVSPALPLLQTATVQREAALPSVAPPAGVDTPTTLPTVMANTNAGEPPSAAPVDVTQLADQVYGLLIRRLTDERARRGF